MHDASYYREYEYNYAYPNEGYLFWHCDGGMALLWWHHRMISCFIPIGIFCGKLSSDYLGKCFLSDDKANTDCLYEQDRNV